MATCTRGTTLVKFELIHYVMSPLDVSVGLQQGAQQKGVDILL